VTAAVVSAPRRRTPRDLVNTSDIALFFWRAYRVRLKPATVRQWAARKHIATYGIRRERYDLREVVAFAQERGVVPRKKAAGGGDGKDAG
jgi:hypothetical protein